MAYQLNSAKDSRGDEQLYMEVFNRLRPQIEAYKQQHGGDLEGAFGAVTGTPWPEGRSVKISHGVPEMTKDRTIGSVLGKFVAAPAAIAATSIFAPGALPAVGKGLLGAGKALGGAFGLGGGAAAAPTATNVAGKVGGSLMKDMLGNAATGAIRGGLEGGLSGAAKGAATGAAGQFGVGGDIMASIMNRGNTGPDPGQAMTPPFVPQPPAGSRVRPQGW